MRRLLLLVGLTSCLTAAPGEHRLGSVNVPPIGLTNPYPGTLVAGAYQYISTVTPQSTYAPPLYSIAQVGDYNSLVPSSISNKLWHQINGPSNCAISAPFHANTIDGGTFGAQIPPIPGSPFITAVDSNPQAETGAGVQVLAWLGVTPPPGTTTWTLSSYMMAGNANTSTVDLGFIDVGCTGSYNSRNIFTPATFASGMTLETQTATPTFGTTYVAHIAAFGTGGGVLDPIVGNIALTPNGITDGGVFSGNFWRVGAEPRLLWYNNRDSTANVYTGSAVKQSLGTEMVIDTDATSMAVELFDSCATSYDIGVWVDGQFLYDYAAVSPGTAEFTPTIKLPGGMKKVEIGNSLAVFSAVAFDGYCQDMLKAVYVPANTTTWVEPEPIAKQRLIVYSDSAAYGDYSVTFNIVNASLIGTLRKTFSGNVYSEVAGGRALYIDVTNETSAPYYPNIQTMVDRWAMYSPTAIWLEPMYNDWANTYWTAAQFGVAYGVFLDAIHARLPQTKIFLQSMTITGHEASTNGNAETIVNFRTQGSNVCAARPWCTFIDGTTILTTTDLVIDGIHPSPVGQEKWANFIVGTLAAAAPSTASPLDWGPRGGQCTLAAGVCTVTDPGVLSTSSIVAMPVGAGATLPCYISALTAGTSFTITCTGAGTDVVNWVKTN